MSHARDAQSLDAPGWPIPPLDSIMHPDNSSPKGAHLHEHITALPSQESDYVSTVKLRYH